jgi:hypothetical protein
VTTNCLASKNEKLNIQLQFKNKKAKKKQVYKPFLQEEA